jgi:putative solute:sodium symporter small subunit
MLHRNARAKSENCKVSVSFSSQYLPEFLKRGEPMQLTAKHHEYWRKNLVVTAILFVVWFIFTFVEIWFARELNSSMTFLGFPLAFYFSAQGSLAIYVALIGIYALIMKKLDKEYGVDEGDIE